MEREQYAIVVAGGKGVRMGAALPKQFLPIGGRPLLMHTLAALHRYNPQMQLVVVLPAEQIDFWHSLCREHSFALPCRLVAGGNERFFSVKNGLDAIPPEADPRAVVGVHDGVRPLVSPALLARCYDAAARCGAAIPALPESDTLRRVADDGSSATVDRSRYRRVQTPQVFSLALLREAYAQPYSPAFTDDASVVEWAGHRVTLVEGAPENIKVTTPFDLAVAQALLPHA